MKANDILFAVACSSPVTAETRSRDIDERRVDNETLEEKRATNAQYHSTFESARSPFRYYKTYGYTILQVGFL